jgi:hypothetical protein
MGLNEPGLLHIQPGSPVDFSDKSFLCIGTGYCDSGRATILVDASLPDYCSDGIAISDSSVQWFQDHSANTLPAGVTFGTSIETERAAVSSEETVMGHSDRLDGVLQNADAADNSLEQLSTIDCMKSWSEKNLLYWSLGLAGFVPRGAMLPDYWSMLCQWSYSTP